MPKLATVEEIRVRLNIGDVDDINAKVSAALDAATLHLTSILRTEFDRQTVSDMFWLDPVQEPWTGEFIQLYLTQGFVFQDPAALPDPIGVEVRYADNKVDLANSDALDNAYVIVQDTKGLVLITDDVEHDITIPRWRTANRFFMSVDYTAGFLTKNTEFGLVYQDVPGWLNEAAIIVASNIFKYDADCSKEGLAKGKCGPDVMRLVERYIRFYPSARKTIL